MYRLGENDVVDLPNQEPATRSPVAVSTSQAVAKRRIFPERFFAHPSSFSTLISDTEVSAHTGHNLKLRDSVALPSHALRASSSVLKIGRAHV